MTVPNILHCENITVKFGGVIANNNVSLHIEEGKVIGLIGPNGAGKTTLFNVLSKFQQHDTGHVYINNQLIDSKDPVTWSDWAWRALSKISTCLASLQP